MHASTRAVVMLAASLAACGGSNSSSTCYDTLVAAAQSCLPAPTATGVLDDAGTTCAYSTGQQVTFTLPENDGVSNFAVTASGSLCMSYQNVDGGVRILQTSAGTAVSSGGSITCPGSVAYTGGSPVGNVSAYSAASATFELLTADGGVSVFNCAG